MPKPEINATRCAILGQLALRDWSSYELTRSMRRTLRWFWPRAESAIYAEARRLESEGLTTSRTEPAAAGSSRTRTIYSITDAGRAALTTWLASDPEVFSWHLEPLLRVHLARFGTRDDALAAVAFAEERSLDLLQDAEDVAREFVAGSHIFQQEVHLRGVLFDALLAQAEALRDWARRARRDIESWPDLGGTPAAHDEALARMRAFLDSRSP